MLHRKIAYIACIALVLSGALGTHNVKAFGILATGPYANGSLYDVTNWSKSYKVTYSKPTGNTLSDVIQNTGPQVLNKQFQTSGIITLTASDESERNVINAEGSRLLIINQIAFMGDYTNRYIWELNVGNIIANSNTLTPSKIKRNPDAEWSIDIEIDFSGDIRIVDFVFHGPEEHISMDQFTLIGSIINGKENYGTEKDGIKTIYLTKKIS